MSADETEVKTEEQKTGSEAETKVETTTEQTEVKETKQPWYVGRIAETTAKRAAAETALAAQQAENELLRKQLETLASGKTPAVETKPTGIDPKSDEFKRLVAEEATKQAAADRFNETCNAMAAEGKKEFGVAFEASVNGLRRLVDDRDAQSSQRYLNLLDAAAATGVGHKVLHELGQDMDEAARIMNLSPVRMGMELARLADGEEGKKTVSTAPTPIKPIRTSSSDKGPIAPDDADRAAQLDTKTWMERRDKQARDRGLR